MNRLRNPITPIGDAITLVAVGDVSPNREDPPSIFRFCREVLRRADIVFGQMEAPLSDRGRPQFVPSAPYRLRPHNISALSATGAGFDVMSFACNHAMDWGEDAFFDTIEILQKNGIEVVGAGKNLQEARIPVIIEKRGTKVGFLAYTAILPLGLEAGEDIPGCAPLRASHYYRQLNYQPGTPPLIVTELVPEYREAMEQDIKKLRSVVDILVVSIHAGVFGVPAMIAMYQKEAGRAAVDAGADLVLQAHAHILKGIEMYKGKAIFYGLGNFAVEHTVPDPSRPQGRDPDFLLYGRFVLRHTERVPAYEKHVHHPDALKTIIAKAYVRQRRIDKVVYLPTFINPDLEPEVLSRQDKRAHQVFDYVKRISEAESLNVNFHWDGDEVVITE